MGAHGHSARALTTRDLGPSRGIDPERSAERAVGGVGWGRGLTACLAGGVDPRGNPESSAQLPLELRGAQGGGTQVKRLDCKQRGGETTGRSLEGRLSSLGLSLPIREIGWHH